MRCKREQKKKRKGETTGLLGEGLGVIHEKKTQGKGVAKGAAGVVKVRGGVLRCGV